MRNNKSLRVCHIVIPEWRLRVNIEKVIKSKEFIQRYVCVKHSGESIEPHYHIHLDMKRRLPVVTIAKWFVLPTSSIIGVYSSVDDIRYMLNSKEGQENTLICSYYEKKAL